MLNNTANSPRTESWWRSFVHTSVQVLNITLQSHLKSNTGARTVLGKLSRKPDWFSPSKADTGHHGGTGERRGTRSAFPGVCVRDACEDAKAVLMDAEGSEGKCHLRNVPCDARLPKTMWAVKTTGDPKTFVERAERDVCTCAWEDGLLIPFVS